MADPAAIFDFDGLGNLQRLSADHVDDGMVVRVDEGAVPRNADLVAEDDFLVGDEAAPEVDSVGIAELQDGVGVTADESMMRAIQLAIEIHRPLVGPPERLARQHGRFLLSEADGIERRVLHPQDDLSFQGKKSRPYIENNGELSGLLEREIVEVESEAPREIQENPQLFTKFAIHNCRRAIA